MSEIENTLKIESILDCIEYKREKNMQRFLVVQLSAYSGILAYLFSQKLDYFISVIQSDKWQNGSRSFHFSISSKWSRTL